MTSSAPENEPATTTRVTDAPGDVFVFPTSFAQQRLWFLDQLVPGNAFYNVDSAMRMAMAPSDVAVLERSLNEVVRRHESLRTTFKAVDGRPVQMICRELPIPLPVKDLRHLDAARRQAEALRLASEEARQPFNLQQGPLLRTTLLRTDEAEYVFLLTMHHIVADGWSIGVFWKELTAIWQAFERGVASPLPPLPIQYADFAVWQRTWLDGGVGALHLKYWKDQLADLPVTEMPTDWPRPEVQSFMGATHTFWIPARLHTQLRRLSHREGVTLFMTLLSAFVALLCRYTGQEDIVVGTPIANRNRAEIEDLIGFFVNSLAMRTDVSGDPPFRVLLQRVRTMALEAYAHQDLPFERLVQELQPERDMGRHPLFQTSFQLFTASDQSRRSAAEDGQLTVAKGTANIDFALDLWEYTDGIHGSIEYSTDLFEAPTISRVANHYLTILAGVLGRPDARVSELPLLTSRERRQLLTEWNATAVPYDEGMGVHQLFEAQVARTPDGIAMSAGGDERVTYAELNATADHVAQLLSERGIGRNDLVGICMERSIDMVASILGIWKSGAAYVPLDPRYPSERMAFIVEDARPKLVLTQGATEGRVANLPVRCVRVDTDGNHWQGASAANHAGAPSEPPDLAYVMYTSGSTGSPKGVMVAQRAVCNQLLWAQSAMPLGPDDRVVQHYSIGFDASVLEIFGALQAGARLVLAPPVPHFDAREFARLLKREAVTAIDTVPSILRLLLEEDEFAESRSLRRATCGGEPLLVSDQEQFFNRFDAELHNAYGPTEATIGATFWTCCREDSSGVVVPIGRPIANTAVYILDPHMNPVPVGVAGEIWIGGHGVARGYLNRPELTAERFVSNPFSGNPDDRLYRSGDRGRFLVDGTIEYLGRVDDQIKRHGVRVEPGEIEACLLRHPSVSACAVVAHESEGTEGQLVAYVVPNAARPEIWPSVGEYGVYDELTYFAMTHDERRNAAYRTALQRVVGQRTVVDVGTGADAVLARLCVERGAARVYAIEILDEAYEQAAELVRRLGLEDRIVVIHGDSTQVELPEKVDVCVSELLGTIGSSEGAPGILNDARRFLKPGGIMIPARCVTRVAAITLPDQLRGSPRFGEQAQAYVDRIFAQRGAPFDLRVCLKNFPREHVISDVGVFEELDFRHPVAAESHMAMRLRIRERARLDGFLVWIVVYPADGVTIDVLDGHVNWLPVFFPAFYPGLEVEPGDSIRAECWRTQGHAVYPDYRIAGTVQRASGWEMAFDYRSSYGNTTFKGLPFYEALFGEGRAPTTVAAVSTESAEQLTRWREVYEELYSGAPETSEPTFNLVGWNSSYTGRPIEPDHMREQVDATVARIIRFEPQRVLEIGCGPGLLLFRLARGCSRYVGTDFSAVALDYVRRQLVAEKLDHVELLERAADDLADLPSDAFDTVILNSVVQYFPSVEYLVGVLEQAVRVTAAEGRIFLGDVRSLPLLEAFYASVERAQTVADGRSAGEWRERIWRRRAEEEELAIAPEFFTALRRAVPAISQVEVGLKRGWHRNELTQFRYDVSLAVKTAGVPPAEPWWRDWREISSVQAIADWVGAGTLPAIGVRGMPNARVTLEVRALEDLSRDGVEVMTGLDVSAGGTAAIEPEELWELGARLGCDVTVSPSSVGLDLMDVVFRRKSRGEAWGIADLGAPALSGPIAWDSYTTDPLQSRRARHLVPALNRYLKVVLPEQMIPSAIVLLSALPRTANGKVDRRALSLPSRLRSGTEGAFVAPRNVVEQRLADIWGELLKYQQLGIHDNFFTHLGGHSLLATQLISRVRDAFEIELPLRRLFEAPTIAELALVVEETLIDVIEGVDEDNARRLVQGQGAATGD